MKNDNSVDGLVAKYNRLVARFRDLEQQATEKQEKWGELEKQFKINESLTRELCELILAKDPSEMRLGKEYSWGKLPTRDIIQKSKSVFASYNDSRTTLLREIQRQSEERRMMIESLQAQVEQDAHTMEELRNLRAAHEDDKDNANKDDDNLKEIVTETAASDDTMKRVPYSTQQAAERGDIEVLVDDGDEMIAGAGVGGKPGIDDKDIEYAVKKTPVAGNMKIWEDKNDVSAADIQQQGDMAKAAVIASVAQSGGNIIPSKKKKNDVASYKANVAKQFVSVDVSQIAEKMNDRHWIVLEIIGSTGVCEGGTIVDMAADAINQNGEEKVTPNGLRYILMTLVNSGALTMDNNVSHPLKNRFAVYALSPIGQSLYKSHFGKNAVTSERDILIAEHDNLEHAFGIKSLKQILEQSSNFSDVSMQRSDNTFRLQDGNSYIPDIVAQCKSHGKSFRVIMEYERGTHHQADFNIKLNKAIKITKHLYIVAPTTDVATHLKDMVASWAASRGGAKALNRITIRITTLRRLTGVQNITNDDNWMYVFKFSGGDDPIVRV